MKPFVRQLLKAISYIVCMASAPILSSFIIVAWMGGELAPGERLDVTRLGPAILLVTVFFIGIFGTILGRVFRKR